MIEKDISNLIGKNLTGSLSKKEEETFKNWLSESDENLQGYQKIKGLWELPVEPEKDTGHLYKRFKLRLRNTDVKESRIIKLTQWKVAVSILVLLSLGLLTTLILKENAPYGSMILQTEKGQRSFAQLPDGSKVWLNAETKLVVGDFSDKVGMYPCLEKLNSK